MKKQFYSFLSVLIALCSCQDENSSLGKSLVTSSFRNVYMDTCTVNISTIYMDSVETTGDSLCQIGHYKDSSWGEVTSSYYAEYNAPSFSPQTDHEYRLDSITLTLIHTGHYWGDTLTQQRISVYRLKDAIELTDGKQLYNRSSLPTESDPLFSFTFTPRPGQKKKLEIRMPDDLGREFLEDLVNEKDVFSTQEKFKNYFHGLALIPQGTGQCATGFQVNDSSLNITLHYQDLESQRIPKELTFGVNTDYAFTGIRHNRSNTPIASLESGVENAVSSSRLSNRAYLQGLTGLYNQVDFPYLNNLQELGDVVSIESATLYLYPVQGTYGTYSQLPTELRLYITNDNNILEDYIYGTDGVTVQTGNLTTDHALGRDTYYSFNITTFIQQNLGSLGMYRQKLLLSLTDNDMTTSFNQAIFGNDSGQDRQCRIDIRYKVYTKE